MFGRAPEAANGAGDPAWILVEEEPGRRIVVGVQESVAGVPACPGGCYHRWDGTDQRNASRRIPSAQARRRRSVSSRSPTSALAGILDGEISAVQRRGGKVRGNQLLLRLGPAF